MVKKSTPKPPLLQSLMRELWANIKRGVASLKTAKGLLAVIPLIVSFVAYVKASISTSELHLIFAEPLTLELRLGGAEGGSRSIRGGGFGPVESFFSVQGDGSMFVSNVLLNVNTIRADGRYDERCTYHHSDNVKESGVKSTKLEGAYSVSASIKSRNYPFELKNGFVVDGKSLLPIELQLRRQSDAEKVNAISEALNATKSESPLDGHAMEILGPDFNKPISMCISAMVNMTGGERRRVFRVLSEGDEAVWVGREERNLASPPVAPGGKDPGSQQLLRISLSAGELEKGLLLLRVRRFSFF